MFPVMVRGNRSIPLAVWYNSVELLHDGGRCSTCTQPVNTFRGAKFLVMYF